MRALVSEDLAKEGLDYLNEHCEVDYRPEMTGEELLAAIGDYEALVIRSRSQVTADVIRAGKKLRIIGRAGVGVNNIDLEAATAQGVIVVNVPDGNTIAACEHTLALMLALARNVPEAAASLAAGRWERSKYTGVELYGKTLGVVGLGRIGHEVGARAKSFGMNIIAHDPFVSEGQAAKLGITVGSLEDVLKAADFLTVHAPLTVQTRNLIADRELAMMKKGARVVNCARGGIINEAALADAVKSGHLAGAAVDVFEKEPPGADNPLLGVPNMLVTPHLGASTVEAQVTCAVAVADQIVRFLTGQPVRNAVNLPTVSEKEWENLQPLLPLAEMLGRLFVQALPGPLEAVEVSLRGPTDARGSEVVANAALAGILASIVEGPVNQVNAPFLARQKGIHFSVVRDQDGDGTLHSITIGAGTPGKLRTIAGQLAPTGQPRITEIDGLPLDMAPAPYMLLDFHHDRPGIIGKVGTILGIHKINIAAMYVGRHIRGGKAVMVVAIDERVPDETLAELRRVEGVHEFRHASLPRHLLGGAPGTESAAASRTDY